MTITKLKTKNQVTLPSHIVKGLRLKTDEVFSVEIEKNYIKLTPVALEPRYTASEIAGIDKIVQKEKKRGKSFSSGAGFGAYSESL